MILPILLYAFIQTGLAEEIFFRGFSIEENIAAIITLIISIDGWFMGYLNEKLASGSIVPSWIVHGLSNLAVSLMSAFNIL